MEVKKKDKNAARARRRGLKRKAEAPPLMNVSPEIKALARGAPTKYEERFCEELITHMSKGGSFESFGGVALVGWSTLYDWVEAHPQFAHSKKIGTQLSLKFFEEMGKMIATGQVRFLKSEKPVIIKNDKGLDVPMVDPNGNVVYHREWEPAKTQVGAWAFMMKNIHGWKDQRNIALTSGESEAKGPGAQSLPAMTIEEQKKELMELQEYLAEMKEQEKNVIDITPVKP